MRIQTEACDVVTLTTDRGQRIVGGPEGYDGKEICTILKFEGLWADVTITVTDGGEMAITVLQHDTPLSHRWFRLENSGAGPDGSEAILLRRNPDHRPEID